MKKTKEKNLSRKTDFKVLTGGKKKPQSQGSYIKKRRIMKDQPNKIV